MFKRSLVIAAVLVVVAVVVLGVVGVSYAQGPGPRGGRGQEGGRGGRPGFQLMHIVVDTAAESLGMEPRDLLESAELGQTLSEVITANGGDPAQVTADAKTEALARIDEALAEGRITEERAEEMRANLDDALAEIMSHPLGERLGHLRPGVKLNLSIVEAVADNTGLSVADIREELRSGKSLATIITENGGSVEAVTAQVMQEATDAINQAVADGKLTQEQADRLLENLPTRIENRLNFNPVPRPTLS